VNDQSQKPALVGLDVNGSDLVEDLAVEPLDPVMLAEVLEALARRLDALEAVVEAVTDQLVEAPAGGPWAWRNLGSSQTRSLFMDLRDWVDWMIGRYELRGEAATIPPCWFLHPVAVEELTGLMVAWKAAYSEKELAPSDALVNWHDRWLWPTLHRLNVQLHVWAKCTGGGHVPPRTVPPFTDEASFASFLGEMGPRSHTERHVGPADSLGETAAKAVLSSGEAVALLPDDPWSPFRYRDRWYGVPDGNQDQLWRPVDEERGAQLDLMHSRLSLVGRPRSGSA
jgi:hypothetical protein